jgi:hypothetical protein
MANVERSLNENRKRRLLKQLDKALGRKSTPATATPAQKERAARSRASHDDARRSYDELKRAILARGGIRANRDFARSEIPADLYRPRTGLPPDEMAQVLTVHGFHYEGDDAMIRDIQRRRDAVKDTASGRTRMRNPSIVCMDIERNARGQFVRHRR